MQARINRSSLWTLLDTPTGMISWLLNIIQGHPCHTMRPQVGIQTLWSCRQTDSRTRRACSTLMAPLLDPSPSCPGTQQATAGHRPHAWSLLGRHRRGISHQCAGTGRPLVPGWSSPQPVGSRRILQQGGGRHPQADPVDIPAVHLVAISVAQADAAKLKAAVKQR